MGLHPGMLTSEGETYIRNNILANRGAYILVIAKTLLQLNRTGRRAVQVRRYETGKLNVPEIRKQFRLELKNRFTCLLLEDDCDVNTGQEEEGEVARDNEVEKKLEKDQRHLL